MAWSHFRHSAEATLARLSHLQWAPLPPTAPVDPAIPVGGRPNTITGFGSRPVSRQAPEPGMSTAAAPGGAAIPTPCGAHAGVPFPTAASTSCPVALTW